MKLKEIILLAAINAYVLLQILLIGIKIVMSQLSYLLIMYNFYELDWYIVFSPTIILISCIIITICMIYIIRTLKNIGE